MSTKTGFGISVDVDISATRNSINDMRASQIPFALTLTLTRLAQISVNRLQRSLPQYFTIRSKRVKNGVRAVPAKKKDYGRESFASHVTDVDDFMLLQITGGVEHPKKSNTIAIPKNDLIIGKGARTSSGALKRAFKPKTVLTGIDIAKTFKIPADRKSHPNRYSPLPFVMRKKDGTKVIVQRKTWTQSHSAGANIGTNKYQWWFQFQKSANIKKRWPFVEAVHDIVERYYFKTFDASLEKAWRSRKV